MLLVRLACLVFCAAISRSSSTQIKDCTTPSGEKSECIPLTSCPNLIKILASDEPQSYKFYRKSICTNSVDPLVCCATSTNVAFAPVENPTPQQSSGINKLDLFPDDLICGLQHSDEYYVDKQQCLSLPAKNNTVHLDDFPWVAVLLYKMYNGALGFRSCTGTLISDRYVLTIESCTKTALPGAVRLGDYDLFKDEDCIGHGYLQECSEPVVDVPIEKIINKNSDQSVSGLSLLRLKHALSYTYYIRPICLKHFEYERLKFGQLVLETGWNSGVIKEKSTAIILPCLGDSCAQSPGEVWTLTVLPNEHDSCFEFTGGPVMYTYNSRWHLVGVFKFGGRCGNKQKGLGAYIDIRDNFYWILNAIEP